MSLLTKWVLALAAAVGLLAAYGLFVAGEVGA